MSGHGLDADVQTIHTMATGELIRAEMAARLAELIDEQLPRVPRDAG